MLERIALVLDPAPSMKVRHECHLAGQSRPAHRRSLHRGETSLLLGELLLLALARDGHPSRIDEAEHALQFTAVEPDAVVLADVENDAGGFREVGSIHQLRADGT